MRQSFGTQTSPASEKTAWAPESCSQNDSAEHDSAFVLLYFWFQLRMFEVTYVQQCGKVDFMFVSLCFQNNLLFALDFFQIPCWNCLELFPFRVHCAFCIGYFHRLCHRDELVYQIVMRHRSTSFARNAILHDFWILFWMRFETVATWRMS